MEPPTTLSITALVLGDSTTPEYVAIHNYGSETVNLMDWALRDSPTARGHRITRTLPAYDLTPSATVRIYTMQSVRAESATDISLMFGGHIWNNGGDTAELLAPDGTVVDTRTEPMPTTETPMEMEPLEEMAPEPEASPAMLVITALELGDADTPEYVEIRNTGTTAIQLEGWLLRDDSANNRLVLPPYSLPPGDTVRVYSRGGRPQNAPDNHIEATNRSSIWNTGGDTARLFAPGTAPPDDQPVSTLSVP